MSHNLRKDHPDFCSPCSVTIYDQDCLMNDRDDGVPVMSWSYTNNVATNQRALEILKRAVRALEWVVEQEQKEIADGGTAEGHS